jgi:hypothetical protein
LISSNEIKEIKETEKNVVANGNSKVCEIFRNGKKINILKAKKDIELELKKIAKLMPEKEKYLNALNCINNNNGILKSLDHGNIPFSEYGLLLSKLHNSYFDSLPDADLSGFEKEATASWNFFGKLVKSENGNPNDYISSYNEKL